MTFSTFSVNTWVDNAGPVGTLVRKWEEEHGESWYESKTTLRQSNELAYNALTRVGKFTGTFEQFERVADVDTVEQSSADPTPTAPGEEASSG